MGHRLRHNTVHVLACWKTESTNTYSEYVILTAFPRQPWLCQRVSVSGYTYTACRV